MKFGATRRVSMRVKDTGKVMTMARATGRVSVRVRVRITFRVRSQGGLR